MSARFHLPDFSVLGIIKSNCSAIVKNIHFCQWRSVFCDEACPGKEQTGAISIRAFSLKNQETASAKTASQ
jgi:hypothetical protein